ncbi:hypothetical protein ACFL3V_06005 [Nanoarchaeota archaeon]
MKRVKKQVMFLVIALILMATSVSAADMWGKTKTLFVKEPPEYLCKVSVVDEERCTGGFKGTGLHDCQLYDGLDPLESDTAQCGFCIVRSKILSQVGMDCVEVKIRKSSFIDTDLSFIPGKKETRRLSEVETIQLQERLASIQKGAGNLQIMSAIVIEESGVNIGTYKNYNGESIFVADGEHFFDTLYKALNYRQREGLLNWLSNLFKPRHDTETKVALGVYNDYLDKTYRELEMSHAGYLNLVNATPSEQLIPSKVTGVLRDGNGNRFAKAFKAYVLDREGSSMMGVRQRADRFLLSDDFPVDMHLAMLEEAYVRYGLVNGAR